MRAFLLSSTASLAATLIFAAACGGESSTEPPEPTSTLSIESAPVSDTIDAYSDIPIVARLLDDRGRPIDGATIEFEVARVNDAPDGPSGPHVLFLASEEGSPMLELSTTTAADGRVSAWVRLGPAAGEVVVRARQTSGEPAGAKDSTAIEVRPGAAYTLDASPVDTSLLVDGTYRLAVKAFDRYQHELPIPLSYESTRASVATIDPETGDVTGVSVGRTELVVRTGNISLVSRLSVVPEGELLVCTGARTLTVVRTDGANMRPLTTALQTGFVCGNDWSRDGRRAVLQVAPAGAETQRIHVVEEDGTVRRLYDAPSELLEETQPRFSPDGQWVYFAGRPGHQNAAIYRARTDGSALERIGPEVDFYAKDWMPSPSPDGTLIAYATNRAPEQPAIRLLEVATGFVHAIDVPGVSPRWSPSGERIAYTGQFNGTLRTMRPDGSDVRTLADGWLVDEVFDWSPDGAWIVARARDPRTGNGSLVVVDVATGEALPLPFSRVHGMFHPAWRP